MSEGFFDDSVKNKRVNIRVGFLEYKAWRAYCAKHNVKISVIIRQYVNDLIFNSEGLAFFCDPNYESKERVSQIEKELKALTTHTPFLHTLSDLQMRNLLDNKDVDGNDVIDRCKHCDATKCDICTNNNQYRWTINV